MPQGTAPGSGWWTLPWRMGSCGCPLARVQQQAPPAGRAASPPATMTRDVPSSWTRGCGGIWTARRCITLSARSGNEFHSQLLVVGSKMHNGEVQLLGGNRYRHGGRKSCVPLLHHPRDYDTGYHLLSQRLSAYYVVVAGAICGKHSGGQEKVHENIIVEWKYLMGKLVQR